MKTNTKPMDRRLDLHTRLAGGAGMAAAQQSPEHLLRRVILANLLWEDVAYSTGKDIVAQIKTLIPQINPETVAKLAIEARLEQKLRHVPLLLAREMIRQPDPKFRGLVGDLLPQIIQRPDELTEFLALYWQDGRCPLAKQVKKGLARAFGRFDAYQLAKWNRADAIKLRDVMFMVRPKPQDEAQAAVWKQLAENTLPTPDTWEVALSAGQDKKETFERLITDRKLGALAFLRNLRGMVDAKVSEAVILQGFKTIAPQWILPVNGLAAARHAPRFTAEIEDLLLKGLAKTPKLPGKTILVVDVSGSMGSRISGKSEMTRLDIAGALAFLARELCERVVIYATAGSDRTRIHQTEPLPNLRGFGLAHAVAAAAKRLGGGGIFTRQCLESIRQREDPPDRIIVFSDSQDCDLNNRMPNPFGSFNYLIDVSAHQRGVAYEGLWTAEISGWSERVLNFVAGCEGLAVEFESDA
ncbi:MAG: TROVE domain-containing protein [Synechococcaceae cyanobacterium SM1_2_3]|nr:TROVE domain-containing protein [Synechococcaceae cyanobacterium SM1_2_3]